MPSQEREIAVTVEAMYKIGIGMLQEDKKGVESIDTQNSRSSGERAVLVSIADTASQQYTKLLQIMADWSGISGEIEVEINTDFIDIAMTMTEVKALNEANLIAPTFTQEEIFNILVKGGIHPETAEYETHKTAIEEETPQLSVSPVNASYSKADVSAVMDSSVMDSVKKYISGN